MDPLRVLAPGDRVTKLVEQALIEDADQDRAREMIALARVSGVVSGQVVALSLGADPKTVAAVGVALSRGGDQDGE
jgi:hypothetical protein